MDKSITNHNILLQVHCCKFGYCCNRFWNFLFLLNYISIIRYNMLQLHRILIQYCMIVHFNKMLETLIFQRSLHNVYVKYTSHKQVIKSGGSSSEHYF